VHHDAIETGGIAVKPLPEAERKAKAAEPTLAESVNGNRNFREERSGGRILRKKLNFNAYLKIGAYELTHSFWRATISGGQASDDMEDFHYVSKGTVSVYLRGFDHSSVDLRESVPALLSLLCRRSH
jgi:hypothetical protein